MGLSVVFLGTPAFAARSLEALDRSGHMLKRVVTRPDQPRGRGLKLQPSEVRAAAESMGLPVDAPARFHDPEFLSSLEALQPDIFAIVAYGVILKERALRIPRLGCINVHASLLPRWRGVSPISWQILAGDREAGVTTQWIDAGVDTGDVIHRDAFPMPPDATTGSLTAELAVRGANLLVRTLGEVEGGTAPRERQDPALATPAPRFAKVDGWVDWTWEAARIERASRAFDPWPGLKFRSQSGAVRVRRAAALEGHGSPGEILGLAGDSLTVGTGGGVLELLEVQPDGGKRMAAGAWARGRAARPGQVLESGAGE